MKYLSHSKIYTIIMDVLIIDEQYPPVIKNSLLENPGTSAIVR
jgi:hypothetical protein